MSLGIRIVTDCGLPLLKVIVMSPDHHVGLGETAWPSMTPAFSSCEPVTYVACSAAVLHVAAVTAVAVVVRAEHLAVRLVGD